MSFFFFFFFSPTVILAILVIFYDVLVVFFVTSSNFCCLWYVLCILCWHLNSCPFLFFFFLLVSFTHVAQLLYWFRFLPSNFGFHLFWEIMTHFIKINKNYFLLKKIHFLIISFHFSLLILLCLSLSYYKYRLVVVTTWATQIFSSKVIQYIFNSPIVHQSIGMQDHHWCSVDCNLEKNSLRIIWPPLVHIQQCYIVFYNGSYIVSLSC